MGMYNAYSQQSVTTSSTASLYAIFLSSMAELVNILDSSDTVTVNGGQFTVNIKGGMPKVYHPADNAMLEVEREVELKEEREVELEVESGDMKNSSAG